MTLSVSRVLREQAERGPVEADDFLACIRESLPYAYGMVAGLASELSRTDREFVENQIAPPDEQARGQLLRALASDAIRSAIERHFDVRVAFQNCHRIAVFRPGAIGGGAYREFTSARSQVLNQAPDLVNC
jgi:hypothetical protein